MPPDIEVHWQFFFSPRQTNGVYEWDLELLAKELILNAPERGEFDLRTWKVFANALNEIKWLDNEWYAFGRHITPIVDEKGRAKLAEAGLDPAVLASIRTLSATSLPSSERCKSWLRPTWVSAP